MKEKEVSNIKWEGRTNMKVTLKVAGRKLFAVGLSSLIMFNTIVPTMQAFAADSTKGIETKVDRTELDKAVKTAKDAGIPVKKDDDVDKGVAKSKSESDAKAAEIKKDYEDQVVSINKAIQMKKDCDAKQKEYEAAKKKYDQNLENYNSEKKAYDEQMEKYKADLKELEKHKNEDGYLRQAIDQKLKFESEPNANVSISGSKTYTKDDWDKQVKSWGYGPGNWGYAYFEALNKNIASSSDSRIILEKGKTTTVTYSNLQNSYMDGVKISKVVFNYTLKSTSPLPNKVPAIIKKDPTTTIWYTDFFGNTNIGVNVQFFDENNKSIDMSGGLLSFSSLNRGHIPKVLGNWRNAVERVANFNGDFLEINGSSVKNHGGTAYSDTNNANKEDGSKYRDKEWDTETSPLAWYGAIVGKAKGTSVNYDMSSNNCGNIWFALNSKIRAKGIPKKPIEPKKPTPPTEPQCPKIEANYHYDVLFYQPPVEKKVNDQNDADINNKAVLKDSVVKFVLNVADLPAGHEKINSLVFKDKLPDGYKVDLTGTKQASSNYDVDYNEGANEIKFTAKSDYLNTINADLSKEAKVAAPVITGTVTKEGTTYKNDFGLTINNDYSVKSKPVKVHTPTKPKKDVFKGSDTTSIDGKLVKAGAELRYEITYKNTTGTKQTVTITDKIPQYTKFVSADNNGTNNNGTITWIKEVENDQSFKVSFKVKVNEDVNGNPIDNTSHVKDGFNETDTNKTHNPTATEPKKEVFKGGTTTKIDGKVVQPEDELTYAITYTNTTDKDVKATITDKLPAHTKFVSAENGGKESGGVVTWTADVEKGKSITVKFTVKVDKDVNGAPIDNKAKVNDGTNDYSTNETHNPTPTEPKKEVFKFGTTTNIDGKKVEPGQKLTYAITYKNTTGSERDVTITDNIPAYTTFVSADNDGKFADGKVTWTKKVAAGETYKVTFTVQVNKDAHKIMVINKANVKDGFNDSDTNIVKNPTPKKPVPAVRRPKTGDDNNVLPFILLLLTALGGLGVTVTIRRKRQ